MRIDHQRRLDRFIGALLCRVISTFVHGKPDTPVHFRPQKILVILLSEMGSLVLAHPMFVRIRKKHPQAEVHLLVFRKNQEFVDVLGLVHPLRLHTVNDDNLGAFLCDGWRILRRLRKLEFDLVIDCELFARISSLIALMTGARCRVGFHPHTQEGLYRGDFITHPVPYNPYHHMAHQYLTLAEAAGSSGSPLPKRDITADRLEIPQIRFPKKTLRESAEKLRRDFGHQDDKKLILLYPGGGLLPIRAWPLDYYERLAAMLIEQGCRVAVIGTQQDRPLAQAIRSRGGPSDCMDLTGYTRSIPELLQLFHLATLLITNDGGPAHFAALTPLPSIVFFGPETPLLYKPIGGRTYVFYHSLSCSPCLTAYNHRHSPCDGHNLCLQKIDPAEVFEKCLQLLVHPRISRREAETVCH